MSDIYKIAHITEKDNIKNLYVFVGDIDTDYNTLFKKNTRDTIFKLATDLGYKVIEKRITRDEVYCADEAFFTGTAAEVTPIRELDNRIIGNGTRGPVTEILQKLYFDCVYGRNDQYQSWIAKGLCQ